VATRRTNRVRIAAVTALLGVFVAGAVIVPALTTQAEGGSSGTPTATGSSPSSNPTGSEVEPTSPPASAEVTPNVTPSKGSSGSSSGGGSSDSGTGSSMPDSEVSSDGVTWVPYFTQNFDQDASTGNVLSTYSDMSAYDGFTDTSGKGLYAPDQVLSVHDSMLDYYLHTSNGQPLVSSVLPDGYNGQTHMRVSIRYRADSIPGYKFVMILWPLSNVWNEGEIDWPEGDLDSSVRPASAIPGTFNSSADTMQFLPVNPKYAAGGQTGWHTATVEWTASNVRFLWDGKVVDEVSSQAAPTVPMRITLQAETTIDSTPVPATSAGHVLVDWVVAYRESN
jgi:hypothetical protein